MTDPAPGAGATAASTRAEIVALLEILGVPAAILGGSDLAACTPITGETIGKLTESSPPQIDAAIGRCHAAYLQWRSIPPPRRGELVRLLGEDLRAAKPQLGRLVTLETGKIGSEGLGEVQEMIDICDFAVGLSRQLYGRTIATERPDHRMMETWVPLGPVGVVTAFNFPVAVWAWNAALALVCGNPVIWKPSEKTSLTALAVMALFQRAAARFGDAPAGLCELLIGGRSVGARLVEDRRVPLVSATGSTAMGRIVGETLARRFGRALLELGGNNAAIVTPAADLDLAVRAIAFAAVGTAGQRCTSLRRLIVHADIHDALVARLGNIYRSTNGLQYTVEPMASHGELNARSAPGTTVRIILGERGAALRDLDTVREVLGKYCCMLRIPVVVDGLPVNIDAPWRSPIMQPRSAVVRLLARSVSRWSSGPRQP